MTTRTSGRIGDVLLRSGMVSDSELEAAAEMGRSEGIRIGEALVRMGVIDAAQLAWALGVQHDLTTVDLDPEMIDWGLVRRYPIPTLRKLMVLPLSDAGGPIRAVVADPTTGLDQEIAELFGGREVVLQLAAADDIVAMLREAERDSTGADTSWRAAAERWLVDHLAVMDGGSGATLTMLQQTDAELFELRYPWDETEHPPVARPLVEALLQILPNHFTSEFPVPGGFAGFAGPFRVTAAHGTRGRLIVFERIAAVPAQIGAVALVEVPDSGSGKKAYLDAAFGVAATFEAHLDFRSESTSLQQFAVADPVHRLALCRRLAPVLCGWLLLEHDQPVTVAGARLLVLKDDPFAEGPRFVAAVGTTQKEYNSIERATGSITFMRKPEEWM